MKDRIALAALALWLATAVVVGIIFVRGNTAPGTDGRTSVVLRTAERDFVLGEMRSLFEATRDITAGIAAGDNAKIIAAAQRVGLAATHDAPPSLLAKLPLEFKKAAMGTHGGFDDLAAAAERGETPQALASRLAAQMDRCTSCHQTYRFDQARS